MGPGVTATTPTEKLLRIGEAAEQCGVSTRTLRYYEELGLLAPSGHTPGGSRRYGPTDVERLQHIRELRDVLGFDLDQIRDMLAAEDRLEELKTEYRKGVSAKRQEAILAESFAINDRLQRHVATKLGVLEGFAAELRAQARRYEDFAADRGIRLPPGRPRPASRR
jgi:DNA-binding transcriptional MerR regulator